MKHAFLVLAAMALMTGAAGAQNGQEYADSAGKYKLTLMGDWKAVSYSDAVGRQKTEFVYRDRSEGLLKITREPIAGSLADAVRQEEETLKIYRAGIEGLSTESFGGGSLNGVRMSFFHTEGGRRMANTFYYFQDKNAMWALRFTGKRGGLDTIRNITDQIARSFKAL